MPNRQLRRASSAVEVFEAFIAARTALRSTAGYLVAWCERSLIFGMRGSPAMRTRATLMPSADVPLIMPAMVMARAGFTGSPQRMTLRLYAVFRFVPRRPGAEIWGRSEDA